MKSKREKLAETPKGIIYLFLVAANKIAMRNQYSGFTIDSGVKEMDFFINSRVESIYNNGSGPFFREDFIGFEEIRDKALAAKDDIISNNYSTDVVDFIESALKSRIPSGVIKVPDAGISAKEHLKIAIKQDRKQRLVPEAEPKVRSAEKAAKSDIKKEGFKFGDLAKSLAASLEGIDNEEEMEYEEEEIDENQSFGSIADKLNQSLNKK